MANTFSLPVFDVLTRDILTQLRICDELLGFCAKPKIETFEIADFEQRVLASKPEETKNDDYLNKMY